MKRIIVSLGLAVLFAMAFTIAGIGSASAEKPKCYACGSGSKAPCSKGYRCFGTRKSCRKKGCRITGYSSTCSTAANVKKCSTRSEFFQLETLPVTAWTWR
jgi:hypothetical protein